MLMSCPFCGTGANLPHETQEACIAALHSEILRIRRVLGRLRTPFAEASTRQAAFAEASARRAAPDAISGHNPYPQDSREDRG